MKNISLKLEVCEYCGAYVFKTYRCPYCNKRFCYYHRAPSKHKCDWTAFLLEGDERQRIFKDIVHKYLTKISNKYLAHFKEPNIFEALTKLNDDIWYSRCL